jgi:phage tail sheath protein FI
MPVQVSYPGVYIQEISSGVHTITGVSTSIAAFLGRTSNGPINQAIRCLSYADFLRGFGGPHSLSDLAQSVRQFFDNGGTDCYVVRLAHNAQTASLVLKDVAKNAVLQATAKNAGNWGNAIYLNVDYNTPNPDDTFNLRVTYQDGGTVISSESFSNLSMNPASARFAPSFVTQSSTLINLALDPAYILANPAPMNGYSESRRLIDDDTGAGGTTLADTLNALIYPLAPAIPKASFDISVNDGGYIPIDLSVGGDPAFLGADDADAIAAKLTARINTRLNAAVTGLGVIVTKQVVQGTFVVFRLTSDVTNPKLSVRIRRNSNSARDLAGPLMLGVDQGGLEAVGYSEFRPVPTATFLTGTGGNVSAGVNTLANLAQNAFNQINITAAPPVVINLGTSLQTTGAANLWYRDGLPASPNGNNDGIREKLRIMAAAINSTPGLPVRAELWGYHLALIPTTGTINGKADFATAGGTDIGPTTNPNLFTRNVRQYVLGLSGSGDFSSPGLKGQDDDGTPLTANDYLGNPLDRTGFYALDTVDLFNLMVLPPDQDISGTDYAQLLIGPASGYCANRRAFLLVDAPASWTKSGLPVATDIMVNDLRGRVVKDHAAVFYPRIQFSDGGMKKYTGSSGMMAGLMARIDSTRGVWKAPAGIEADLRNVLDLETNLTDLQNGVLNKLGVNCIRKFPNGIVSWGSRTLDGADDIGSEWKYIPIRRFALFLEESLFRGTKWVVFEPNDEPLWAQIRLNLNAFMMSLFRQGAFQGTTPDKAFFVKCDKETTTQNDRNLGIVNIEVGFAPLKPAEFVIIKIQQIAGDL